MEGRGGRIGFESLVITIERYGEALEADFHRQYRLDILDFFRLKYTWRKFKVLLEALPAASLYAEAVAGDVELAEAQAKIRAERAATGLPDRKEPYAPRLSEFDPVVAELTVISDRIAEVLVGMTGGKAKFKPRPRPVLASQKVAERERVARIRGIEAEVLAGQERWRELREQKTE